MKNIKRRIVAVLLSIAMIINCAPVENVKAEDDIVISIFCKKLSENSFLFFVDSFYCPQQVKMLL